ncbi:hypothetical protein AAHE18_15G142400 [Arachis hypogaea]
MQLKGFMELSGNAYKLLTRMFEWKNISIETWLTFLWESRRLSHALCVSPISDDVQKAAPELISNLFTMICAHCPRLVANGRLIEALSFAKEAHHLHSQLFHKEYNVILVHRKY